MPISIVCRLHGTISTTFDHAQFGTGTLGGGGGRWPSASGLERWLGLATDGPGRIRIPLRQLRFGTLAILFVNPALSVSFGGDTKSRRSLLSGVYASIARGSKISHQSAL